MAEPNDALAALLAEADCKAGCSAAGLARRVNELGRALEGTTFRYDYSAVYRWVRKGEQPRPPVPSLIARALSEKLGRRVTPAELGMSDTATVASRGLAYPADAAVTVDTILDLGRADVKRRDVVTKAPYVFAALAAPSRDWLLSVLGQTTSSAGPRKVGLRQVAGIRDMFRLFQEMDVMRGGGHGRVALVEYMDSYVLPLLKEHHKDNVRLALFEAASEQAYLAGWMAYDDGQHGLAQRYLIQSLRLAQESKNAALGAHVLAGMSDQANLLGYPAEALALAKSGQQGITEQDSPACLADLCVLEGRAHARLGDGRASAHAVARAERVFQRVVPDNEPEWARFIDGAYLFGEASFCFRDMGRPSETARFAGESAEVARHQGRARRGALSQAAIAVAHLEQRDVEAAAHASLTAVDLAASVQSSRCKETVRDLRRRFQPYQAVPAVQEFDARARQLLAA
ncbi:MAG TPA: hypothetical protein VGS19_37975 [Streptosporangiaceae bacterium]|nr:hypothetical protein [Streptosporangiaceae bacterium]